MSSQSTPAKGAERRSGSARARQHAARVGRRELRFLIYRAGSSLTVERRQRAEDGVASLAVLHFDDGDAFEAWWREDALRFDHPILHQALRRDASELWELGDESSQ